MKSKRALSLLLASLMLFGSTACGGDDTIGGDETTASEETSAPEVETDPAETEFDRRSISDELPEVTFEGKEFRILCQEGAWMDQYTYDEELTGDSLNSAIWKRNEDVEKRFDTKLVAYSDGMETQDTFFQFVMAQENMFEVADLMMYMSWTPMIYNMAVNWYDIPNINWEKPWWNKATNDEATVKGKAYAITGDLSLTSLTYMWIQAFNMELMADWGYSSDDIYQLVFDGEWTIDKFIEICSTIHADENGNSTPDKNDTFGYFTHTYSGTDPWVTAIDARMLTKNDEGNLEVTLGTEKVYNTLAKLNTFFFSNEGCFHDESDTMSNAPDFAHGKIAIYPANFSSCLGSFAKLPFEYGVLPYPKYDTAQKNYVTGAIDQLSVYSLPVTLPLEDYEFVGIMMEALNAESYKTVYPAYFDGALKGRYSTDENMSKVVDLIVEGRMFDLAFMYGQYMERLPYQFRYCFRDNDTDLASRLAANMSRMEEEIEDLMLYYETGEQVWY
ncbi:MAG: hypothetical protein E7638_07135 [Ruminococcaceae bacterium]|nr:hypothetical protein [Oscillospiraceae bacterium]